MKRTIKTTIFALGTFSLMACSTLMSCSKDDDNTKPTVKENSCDFTTLKVSETGSYDFSSDFSKQFSQSTRWESNNADITLVKGKGQLTANSADVSSALEAWKLYKKQMPYNKSWEISVAVTIPTYWNSNGGNNAQVGAGIFVGKPVTSGQSAKVYECNMAAVNGGERFVQAQLVANRLGDDPIDVQRTVLANDIETATLKIRFCTKNKSLSLYIDNKKVGKSQAINQSGLDNWKISETGMLDVGIMGFAENTVITSNQPTLDNFKFVIY